jgi:D-beta-D-heptose 7-phosphate kinase / D-beta-D-heptose 1-phosphate adenosyltransferase
MSDRIQMISLVERLSEARVLCLGDVMLDQFVYGHIERISPEAPIPIFNIDNQDSMLGGAGNVARNIAALGGRLRFLSVAGTDVEGDHVSTLLRDLPKLNATLVRERARRTTVKTRFLSGTQQTMRTDWETLDEIAAPTQKKIIDAALKALASCSVVVMSDYGKGVLSSKVIKAVLSGAKKAKVPVIVDPKGSDYGRYRGANVITPNRNELAIAAMMTVETDKQVVVASRKLIKKFDLGAILATRSHDGMTLVTSSGNVTHFKAEAQEVFDVSGAGDTVVAWLSAALGAGADLKEAAALANVAAGIVVAKVGTASVYPNDAITALHHQDLTSAEAKVAPLPSLLDSVKRWRKQGLKVGFTNGCFDLLHPGHVSLLSQAKKACDRLVVGLNSDTSVRTLKGKNRPVQSEAARSVVLASLASVDKVVIFSEETPLEIIKAISPDVLVKGADYKVNEVVGAKVVQKAGGKVLLVDLEPGHSTTGTISRIEK